MREKINPSVFQKIKEKNHYLASNSIIPLLLNKEFIEYYSQKKFMSSLFFFKRAFNANDVTPNLYQSINAQYKSIVEDIEQHERTILPKLEKLAEKLVRSYFNLSEGISFEIKIEDDNSRELYGDSINPEDEEFANYLEIAKRSKQIDRNRFNYAFIVGAANECADDIYSYIEYIDELNPKLSEAYNKYIALNRYNVWVTPDEVLEKRYNHKKYFYVLDMGYGTHITVYAPNFIIALNQSFLAVFSLLMGCPFDSSDISYSSAWNMRLGGIFWGLFKKHFKSFKHLQYFLKEISKLTDEKYEFLFKEILSSTKLSAELCSKIAVKYNKNYE